MPAFQQLNQNNVQSIIASFLIQHKTCSLPGIGTLRVQQGTAKPDFPGKQILAPIAQFGFSAGEETADELVKYISVKKQVSNGQALSMLSDFCAGLHQSQKLEIPAVGKFILNADQTVSFVADEIPAVLLQPVNAERVMHPDAEHTMLVGDKETTNTEMNEYYKETPVQRTRWGIWAIVIAVASIAALAIHFSQNGFSVQSTGCVVAP